jgi:predicted dehydrogenase
MADILRIGMIGCDTSHCGAFTQMFNDPKHAAHQPGFRVAAAYPSFSPDLKSSAERVDEYKKTLSQKHGVKMVESIEALLGEADVLMIESVDGRRHLPELKAVAKAGKPVYIDKPFAASLADAKEMVRIIKEAKLPAFSTSSLRFDSAFTKFLDAKDKHGKVLGCDAYSPAHLEPTNPGLFWYGIHGVEILFTIMGRGCKTVSGNSTDDADLAVGVWDGGRIGTMRGLRHGGNYGAMVITEKSPPQMLPAASDFYPSLVAAMAKFFKTKESPVAIEETLEIMAFIDGALRSTKKNGEDVALES